MAPKRKKTTEEDEGSNKKKKNNFGLEWQQEDTFYALTSKDIKESEKVLAFDMDHTLVSPKSGAKFPTNRNDWEWTFKEIPDILKQKYKDGYKIIIFSNQAGFEKGKVKESDIKGKILDLCDDLEIPMQAFLAGATDKYRKPNILMWEKFVKEFNNNVTPKEAMYIGDAAGRPAGWKQGCKKDFSCDDRKFAYNIGIKFQTPDEFFLGEEPAKFDWYSDDPRDLFEKVKDNKLCNDENFKPTSDKQEMIILIGRPASGKSTFSENYLVPKGYVRINRDTLKTMPKCQKVCKEELGKGNSVVIDNTNPTVDARSPFIEIAKEFDVPVRCFILKTPKELNEHLNLFRERLVDVRRIPDVAYRTFDSKYEEPTKDEGIESIHKINFVPKFKDEEAKELFFLRT